MSQAYHISVAKTILRKSLHNLYYVLPSHRSQVLSPHPTLAARQFCNNADLVQMLFAMFARTEFAHTARVFVVSIHFGFVDVNALV